MFNKKYISTFLFIMALVCLFTLIVPFMNVNFIGEATVALKILYYTFYLLYILCLVVIIVFGIYNLFKNTYTFSVFQEISAYTALVCLMIIILFFLPQQSCGLSVGFSILTLETLIMACFNKILQLIRRSKTNFKAIKNIFVKQKEKINKIDEVIENENIEAEIVSQEILDENNKNSSENQTSSNEIEIMTNAENENK